MASLLESSPLAVSLPSAEDFLDAERLMAASYPSEVALYEAIQRASARLVPLDAFYVCLVRRDPAGLHFVYNCEGDHFDTPEPYPMGDGPTSRVAKTGRPVVMVAPEDRAGLVLSSFANAKTQSGSALHWPLWIDAATSELPEGVLSVQAYASGAYGEAHLAAMEWLALRVADAMRRRCASEGERRCAEAAALAASRNQAIHDVKRFVAVLQGLLPVRNDPARLVAEIRRQQVALTSWAPTVPVAQDPVAAAVALLSDRELEVLVHAAQGLSNEEVGEALSCSKHTVKRHLDNVYARGVLTRRAEIANAAATVQAAWMARKGQ